MVMHFYENCKYSQANIEMPLSDTGVSQRFSTCRCCKCSLISCRPASPNCVAHRFRYLRAGSLISCSAHADVTEVKARLRHSRLPRAPPPNRTATSASVARTGSVNLRGPPFCCCQDCDQITYTRWTYTEDWKKREPKNTSNFHVESRNEFCANSSYQFLQIFLLLAERGVTLLPGCCGLERVNYLKPRFLVWQ